MICDPMTWQNLSQEHPAISLLPTNLPTQKIKFLFCESTWSGTTNACWRGQVYKDERVLYENRHNLLKILNHYKSKRIPTVFWAKEDPAYFQDSIYNFTDTALKFDYILTTAEECIPRYNALGHKQVHLWPFGFSPKIYYPPKNPNRENIAIFAGSWYEDHPNRCQDLSTILDAILTAKIPIRIYDRNRLSGNSTKPFPTKYQPYVQDSVSYEALGNIYRKAEYVINVNTICDSATMFSRRVYEAMACGCIIISNESTGLRNQFNNNIWFITENEEFDLQSKELIRQENIQTVFTHHTWAQRMNQLTELISKEQTRK